MFDHLWNPRMGIREFSLINRVKERWSKQCSNLTGMFRVLHNLLVFAISSRTSEVSPAEVWRPTLEGVGLYCTRSQKICSLACLGCVSKYLSDLWQIIILLGPHFPATKWRDGFCRLCDFIKTIRWNQEVEWMAGRPFVSLKEGAFWEEHYSMYLQMGHLEVMGEERPKGPTGQPQ